MTLFVRLLVLYGPTILSLSLVLTACGAQTKDIRAGGLRGYGDLSTGAGSDDANPHGTVDQNGNGQGPNPGDQSQNQGGDPQDPNGDTTDVRTLMASAGIRNYEQINATMAALTGIPATTPAVRDEFQKNLSGSLPTDNDVRAFLGSQQVAVFKLAVEYCDALVKNTTARAAFFGDFNFAAAPSTALDTAGKDKLAGILIAKLWGTGMDSLPGMNDSKTMVVSVLDQIMAGKNLSTVALTPAIVTGACTAVLSSAPVTLF